MPIIQEISDDEHHHHHHHHHHYHRANPSAAAAAAAAQADDAKKAEAALDKCLRMLDDDTRPLESRYTEVLSTLSPLVHHHHHPALAASQPKLLRLLRPHLQLHQQNPDDDDLAATTPALPLFHILSQKLLSLLTQSRLTPTAELAAVLASLSSLADPWTTPETCALSTQLLASTPALHDRSILIDGLLTSTLKPLFTVHTSSAARVTPSGRLAIRESTNHRVFTDTPAWQQHRPECVAILAWVISALPNGDIEAAWGLLIPPVLTLLDSTSSAVKTRAVDMIELLLHRLEEGDKTRTLLQRTGLAPVFWDAVLPCLSYLPPLTPTPEAVPLLRSAYSCLLTLTRETRDVRKRRKQLDELVREGFLRGLTFAGEHVLVVEVITYSLTEIVEELGVGAVRHLKNVVPALAEILAGPFTDLYPPLLVATSRALVAVIRNCWERVDAYVCEVMRGVVVCWVRVGEEVRRELRAVVAVLRAVMVARVEGLEKWGRIEEGVLREGGEGMRGLFLVGG